MVAACSVGILPNVIIDWPALPVFNDRQLHVPLRDSAISVATFLLALGMAGVGWETRLVSLLRAGWRPMIITTLVSIFLAAAALCGSLEFFS
jgi:uncharacterized membrane protein YadS